MQLILATQNPNKIKEIKPLLPSGIKLMLPTELGYSDEIPENSDTIEENAVMKAQFIHNKYGIPAFADDTGLEVDALRGAPGVYSARYAGEDKNAEKNIEKLLTEMKGVKDRRACFRTVIALVMDGSPLLFEGKVNGKIADKKAGVQGFGYDPLFIPDGSEQTFAEMSIVEKNRISHRAVAVRKFARWLEQALQK